MSYHVSPDFVKGSITHLFHNRTIIIQVPSEGVSRKPRRNVPENREVVCPECPRDDVNAKAIHRFLGQADIIILYVVDIHIIYDVENDCSEHARKAYKVR